MARSGDAPTRAEASVRGPSGGADSVRPLRGDHSRFRIRNDLLGDRAAGWPLPTVMAGATAREPRREIVFPPDARIAIPWASENEWAGAAVWLGTGACRWVAWVAPCWGWRGSHQGLTTHMPRPWDDVSSIPRDPARLCGGRRWLSAALHT